MYFSQSKHFQWPKKTFQKKKKSSELKPPRFYSRLCIYFLGGYLIYVSSNTKNGARKLTPCQQNQY